MPLCKSAVIYKQSVPRDYKTTERTRSVHVVVEVLLLIILWQGQCKMYWPNITNDNQLYELHAIRKVLGKDCENKKDSKNATFKKMKHPPLLWIIPPSVLSAYRMEWHCLPTVWQHQRVAVWVCASPRNSLHCQLAGQHTAICFNFIAHILILITA